MCHADAGYSADFECSQALRLKLPMVVVEGLNAAVHDGYGTHHLLERQESIQYSEII